MNSTPTVASWLQLGGVLAAQVALLVMLAAVLERFTKSGLWRRTLWQACFVSSVLLLLGELGGFQRGVNRWIRVATTSPVAPPPLTGPMRPQPLAELIVMTEAVSLAVPPAIQTPEPTLQEPATWWPAMVWLGGFLLLATRGTLARFVFFFFHRRRQRALNDPVLLERLRTMVRCLGIQRRVNVTQTTGLNGPITYGIIRPCISLPEKFSTDFTPAKQEVMLAHELAHLAARDPLWHALAELVAALLWWHPLIWWARRRLRTASEIAADEASLIMENGPVVLAECLVELGGRLTRTRPLGWLGIEGNNFRSDLGQRVKRLVNLSGRKWRPLQRTSAWLIKTTIPLTLVLAVFAGTAWTQPRDTQPGTLLQAFQQSFLELALTVSLPADRGLHEASVIASAPLDPNRIDWKPWSRVALEEAHAAGKVVLVNFTADWCVPAKMNETTSLEIPPVRAKLRELGVVTLRADNTVEDSAIAAELRQFGRAGVPLVLVYSLSEASPKVLPELLTPQIVLDALDDAASLAAAKAMPEPEPITQSNPKNDAPMLILAGKALLEAGRFNEAEAKLREAMKLDPANNAAKQYLAQLQTQRERVNQDGRALLAQAATDAKSATNVVSINAGRQRLMQKLDSIVLGEVSIDDLPLGQVIESLSREAKARDPEGRGINFIISGGPTAEDPPATNIMIRVRSSLRNVTLRQVLDAIVQCSEQPIKYSIEDYAIVFSLGSVHPLPLYTRWFKIDLNTFVQGIRGIRVLRGVNPPRADLDATLQTPVVPIELSPVKRANELNALPPWKNTISIDEAIADARRFFSSAGVDLAEQGKTLAYNDRLNMLMVRATLQDLDIIEQTIQVLNTPPSQVVIEVKFCELDEEDERKLGFEWMLDGTVQAREKTVSKTSAAGILPEDVINYSSWTAPPPSRRTVNTLSGILTEPQFRVMLSALEKRRGVNVLSSPRVTTMSGRQAQIKTVEVRYIVTGLNPSADVIVQGKEEKTALAPQAVAEMFELGPVIDVIPYVQADGVTITMTVIPRFKEFVGYDLDSEKQIRKHYNSGDPKDRQTAPMETAIPLPIFRLRQMVTSATVWDGQTLVLSGGAMNYEQNGKTLPADAGAQKGAARLFGGQKSVNRKKSLLVFVTPTIIDAAGNRVHPAGTLPFRQDSVPPQKPVAPPSK